MTTYQFLEELVLTDERDDLIERTFPQESEEYWYYKLLTLQARVRLGEEEENLADCVDIIRTKWSGKDGNPESSQKMKDLLLKQDLFTFDDRSAPEVASKLQARLEPKDRSKKFLNHEQDITALDPEARPSYKSTINVLTQQLLKSRFNGKEGQEGSGHVFNTFSKNATSYIAEQDKRGKLTPEDIEGFVKLMADSPPSAPYLLTLLKKDLVGNKIEFGQRALHKKLTREQMEMLLDKHPSLISNQAFCQQYVRKMRPVSDAKLSLLLVEPDFLVRLLDFGTSVKSQVSFKALILFNVIRTFEQLGDKEMAYGDALKLYLSLPRKVDNGYLKTKTRKNGTPQQCVHIDFKVDALPEFLAIGDDVEFVKRAVNYRYLSGKGIKDIVNYLNERFHRVMYAEYFLTNTDNIGNKKKEKAILAQQEIYKEFGYNYQDLVDEVNLQLTPDNPAYYKTADPVTLKLSVKNVQRLLVNVYEVDGKNYYLAFQREVPEDIDLSGSSPIITETYLYNSHPLERRTRVVQLQKLQDRRGVFVIDIIGGGYQSRALIRKGELRFIQETDVTGYNFRVFTDEEQFCETATITMDGITYEPSPEGVIKVPFSPTGTNPNQMIILDDDAPGAATLHYFTREEKYYEFHCGIHLDRESLLEGKEATIVVLPSLFLNNEWCPIADYVRGQGTLMYTTEDNVGRTIQTVAQIDIYDNIPTTTTFTVPKDCVKVTVNVEVSVEGQAFRKEEEYVFSTIDKGPEIADMFLYPYGRTGYVLAVLGKNGEPYPAQVLDLLVTHSHFKQPLKHTVETDANGRVFLGRCYDCTKLIASCANPIIQNTQTWNLLQDICNLPREINQKRGTTFYIPTIGTTPSGPKFEVYDSEFLECFTKCAKYEDGYILIDNLPPGNFQVIIQGVKPSSEPWEIVTLLVSEGMETENEMGAYVINRARALQLSEEAPLQIRKIVGDRFNGYRVSLGGFGPRTNVMVVSSRFMPRFSMYNGLCSNRIDPDHVEFTELRTTYTKQRELFGEYKYVLERSFNESSQNPGNMLGFPSFQTNSGFCPDPRPVRDGDPPKEAAPPPVTRKIERKANRERHADRYQFTGHKDISNISFLPRQSYLTIFNPSEISADGEIIIEPKSMGAGHHVLTIIATDEDNTTVRYKVLDSTDEEDQSADTRMVGLDPQRAFCERRSIRPLMADQKLTIDSYRTAQFQTVKDRTGLFKYFLYHASASGNKELKGQLMDFAFMTTWNVLTNDEKLTTYDKFNCNEVNLFLRNTDPAFFNAAVKPLLQSKVIKTFFDLYLLDNHGKIFDQVRPNIYIRQNMNYCEKILLAHSLLSAEEPVNPQVTLEFFKHLRATTPETPERDDTLFEYGFTSCLMSVPSIQRVLDDLVKPTGPVPNEGVRMKTRVSLENNYYRYDSGSKKVAAVTKANKFWCDYANYMLRQSDTSDQYFLSDNFLKTAENGLNEMLLAMAVMDLPFQSGPITQENSVDGGLIVAGETPSIPLVREVAEIEDDGCASLSIYCIFYDQADATTMQDGVQFDRFLTESFVTKKKYTCRVVLTNVLAEEQRCEVLCQLPSGTIPLGPNARDDADTGFKTKNHIVTIPQFATESIEFSFYWPTPGTFKMFRPHVTVRKGLQMQSFSAISATRQMNVTEEIEILDRSSWKYISQAAENEDVLQYLAESVEVPTVALEDICWRLKADDALDGAFLNAVVQTLKGRGIYSEDIWSYSLLYPQACKDVLIDFLALNTRFQRILDAGFYSPDFVSYNIFSADSFNVLEYAPMVSKRGHNDDVCGTSAKAEINAQYSKFLLKVACSSTEPENIATADKLCLVYYLSLLSKPIFAREVFEEIDEEEGPQMGGWSYHYMNAYLSLTYDDRGTDTAVELSQQALDDQSLTPAQKVKWQQISDFCADAANQDLANDVFDEDGTVARRKALEPWLDFSQPIDNILRFEYRNLPAFEINYYATDIERLFSNNPFADQQFESYGVVAPVDRKGVMVDGDGTSDIPIPKQLRESQLIVEVKYGANRAAFDRSCVKPIYHQLMVIQVSREIGEIRALNKEDGSPIAGGYAKVYARLKTGETIFYKDGYTDFRGRFNYQALTSSAKGLVEKYALMILDLDNEDTGYVGCGAAVQEIVG